MKNRLSDFDVSVAKNVKEKRVELGISQRSMAKTLGITYQSYQKIENGKVSIKARDLWQIAKKFDVGPELLVKEETSDND